MDEYSLLLELSAVHRQVKRNFIVGRDPYDQWLLPPLGYDGSQTIRGDCEDFSLACRYLLRQRGIASRLVYCVVNGVGHLVVEVDGWILDNLQRAVVANTALYHYRWLRISGYHAGDPWREII